jgi:hypothetical protein
VYPARVKEFEVRVVAVPETIDCVAVDGDPEPSFALNVTVLEFAFQTGYRFNVVFEAKEIVA